MQKETRKGDDDDPLTWDYFAIVGKVDELGVRQFQYDRRQFHPTHFQNLGKTLQSSDDIDLRGVFYLIFSIPGVLDLIPFRFVGRGLVKEADPYQLILNNCQSFVIKLWFSIDDCNPPWEEPDSPQILYPDSRTWYPDSRPSMPGLDMNREFASSAFQNPKFL